MGRTWDVRRFDEIDSTNRYLLPRGRARAPRRARWRWPTTRGRPGPAGPALGVAPGASLLASVLFRPEFDPAELHLCTAAVALAAAEACRREAGVGPVLKWPNDLLVGGAKLAGVLAEADFGADRAAAPSWWGSGSTSTGPGRRGERGPACVTWARPAGRPRALLAALLDALSARRALLDSAAGRRERGGGVARRCATLGRGSGWSWWPRPSSGWRSRSTTPATWWSGPRGPRTVSAGDVVHLRRG